MAGKRLPRAISFCAALYSIGLPPELLGLSDLKPSDVKTIQEYYPNFLNDLMEAMLHYDPMCLAWLPVSVADDIRRTLRLLKLDFTPDLIHQSAGLARFRARIAKNDLNSMSDLITQAARERRVLPPDKCPTSICRNRFRPDARWLKLPLRDETGQRKRRTDRAAVVGRD